MLKKLYQYLKRKMEITAGFHRHTKYMCEGTYVYDNSIKYLIRNDPFTKNRAFQIFQNNYYQTSIKFFILLLRNTLFRKKVLISDKPEESLDFAGSIYRPVRSSNGYNDSKIFDLSRNKVLTIFSNEQEFQSVFNIFNQFNEYFPMPAILFSDSKKLIIIEELVNFKQIHTWGEAEYLFVMEEIIERNMTYLKTCIEKGSYTFTSPRELLHAMPATEEIKPIINQISRELMSLQFPFVPLHGDLWTANTLLVDGEKCEICYIDWEYSKEYIFFYDLFHMIWLEVYVNNNQLYFTKYARGDYDLYFKKIFSLFSLEFDDQLRMDYLNIYFLNLFKERIVQLDMVDQLQFINHFKRFIGNMKVKS